MSRMVWLVDSAAVLAYTAAAEGRATARCMDRWTLDRIARELEQALERLPRAQRKGIVARVSTGQRVPNSYRGLAERTCLTLVWASRGWAVTGAGRELAPHVSGGTQGSTIGSVTLTQEQADILAAGYRRAHKLEVVA